MLWPKRCFKFLYYKGQSTQRRHEIATYHIRRLGTQNRHSQNTPGQNHYTQMKRDKQRVERMRRRKKIAFRENEEILGGEEEEEKG